MVGAFCRPRQRARAARCTFFHMQGRSQVTPQQHAEWLNAIRLPLGADGIILNDFESF
jgi:hypothetical protein